MNIKSVSNDPQYSFLAKLMHWGFVLIFIYGLIKQIDNVNQLEDNNLLKFEVLFALAFLSLLAIRFLYMRKTQQSSLPECAPKSQKLAAKIVHFGMYICLATIPFSGLIIALLFWLGLKDGVLINIVIGAHEFSASLLYWLIGIHFLASIYHRFKKDGVWASMVPFWKENNSD